jgi:hypothetical protein
MRPTYLSTTSASHPAAAAAKASNILVFYHDVAKGRATCIYPCPGSMNVVLAVSVSRRVCVVEERTCERGDLGDVRLSIRFGVGGMALAGKTAKGHHN